ncbi:MAG: hypothetical protein HC875_39590, partial [Anaerolineales bacterium]|nr:hypothetical protein [Anaerolineales bacterium]
TASAIEQKRRPLPRGDIRAQAGQVGVFAAITLNMPQQKISRLLQVAEWV